MVINGELAAMILVEKHNYDSHLPSEIGVNAFVMTNLNLAYGNLKNNERGKYEWN